MKRLTALLLLVMMSPAFADHRDVPINSASELRDWCKSESEATFIGRGLKPYNWSASYSDEGNVLIATGEWLIDTSIVKVECRVARGARREFASMSIQEP